MTEVKNEDGLNLNFSITVDEANIIIGALGELPAKISMELIRKLQLQAAPQLPKKTETSTNEE
jgi:hypothetical protein